MSARCRVVIIGAGYAGVMAANRLAGSQRWSGSISVTVLNPVADFVERIRLHEVAAGSLESASVPMRSLLHGRAALVEGTASRVAPRPAARTGTVTDYARAALDAAPEGRFTIVAHSAGGVVASELVRLAPERVTGLVAVAAVIPATGASFTSSLPFPNRMILSVIMRMAGTRPPETAIRNSLAAGLDEATVRQLLADLVPEPRSYFTSRTASNAALASLPKTKYILTTDDAEIPAKLQRRYAARLRGPRIVEIPGGHLPMLAHTATLRSAIADFIAPEINETVH